MHKNLLLVHKALLLCNETIAHVLQEGLRCGYTLLYMSGLRYKIFGLSQSSCISYRHTKGYSLLSVGSCWHSFSSTEACAARFFSICFLQLYIFNALIHSTTP